MKDKYIDLALVEAKKAYLCNEVPVGAVIVKNNEVLACCHNMKTKSNNVLNHAELLALTEAARKIGDWRLYGCDMYVTLEPCPMCASAAQQSRIRKIYIGTSSNIQSNRKIIDEIFQSDDMNHKVDYTYLNNKECADILSSFFANKR